LARKLSTLVCIAAAIALGGCLGRGPKDESSRIAGGTVTVYASLPRHGVSHAAGAAVEAGQRLALADARGRAGGLRVRLVTLDSTAPGDRLWDPGRVNANAERAVGDDTTIAYLGELDFGGSAVSLPITNDAGVLQLSAGDGLTSLTRQPPGRPRAGPARYYPTGTRNFLRLIPNDLLQAETLLEQARAAGAERLAVVYESQIYGRELAGQLLARARRDGPEPVGSEEYAGRVEDIPDLARSLAEERPDAVAYAGVAGPGTGRLLAAIDRELPGVPVLATSGMLVRDRPVPAAPSRVEAFTPVRPASELPPAGRRLLRRLRRLEGRFVARPEAVYGYEAMRVVLDAIRHAGPDRRRVIAAALAVRTRRSPIGVYGVRATGDVDREAFALYAMDNGRFEFERIVGEAP
jgi:branched-chain amino acid transport system substrate-binding protein